MAILIRKSLPLKVLDCIKDTGGRYVIIRGILYGEEIAFMSIYCPPGLTGDYLISAFTKLANLNIRNSFVGGDFNCHLNPLLDKSPVGKHLLPQAKMISTLCEELTYVDVWREQHLMDKEFTFFSKVHACYTRIDYFFAPKTILSSIINSSIGNIIISDHAAVFIEFDTGSVANRTRRWHLDSSILYDQKFTSYFVEEFKQFLSINIPSTDNPSLLWETSKAYSRGLITSYTKSKRRIQTEQRRILESKLKKAEKDYFTKSSNNKLKEISALRSALNCLLTNEAERKIRFAKQKLYEHGDKPGKYLAYLTKKKSDSQNISSIIDDNGIQFFDTTNINNAFRRFYVDLYDSEMHSNSLDLMDNFFSRLNLPCLTEDQRSTLNSPISRKELLDVIKGLQSGKAAGPDGLSSEFYKEFGEILVDPLLNMYNDSFMKGILPMSLREANISLILKKGKPSEDCGSYRPISLLNVDLKILSKILAKRLEKLLPLLINQDQTGFIKGRNSYNNMRRLLNAIEIFHQKSMQGLVLSLDAEKAFDRVEWPFLFHTLHKFGLGDSFIAWIKLLYSDPYSAVLTNGLRSPNFQVYRGTRQGCPLSPLLFALAIEPLAEAVRIEEDIHGLAIGERHHKITLYADDVLIFLTQPEISVPSLIQTISKFSTISGYKINFNKSEAMPLGVLKEKPKIPSPFPFTWSPDGFVYLGIKITPKFNNMYKCNFIPLFDRIKLDFERWKSLPLSWLGRISLLKMNVLPRLLYPIQMIPVLFSHKIIKTLNGWMSSFIWAGRKPRLKMSTLCLPSSKGGLDIPDIRKYQLSAHVRVAADWVQNPLSLWLDIEGSMSKIPLKNLLFLKKHKNLKLSCSNPLSILTVRAWQIVQKYENRLHLTSLFTPLCNNPLFPPGMIDCGFRTWAIKGVVTLSDLMDGPSMFSFHQLVEKYDIKRQDFFRYLQVRDYVQRRTSLLSDQSVSEFEKQLFLPKLKTSIKLSYNLLKQYVCTSTLHLKEVWQNELGMVITDEEWDNAWKNANSLSVCNRVKALQLKILHRAHISPSQRSKFNSELSPFCLKCKIDNGTLTHCYWSCRKIQNFWYTVKCELDKIFSHESPTMECNPLTMLLGMTDVTILGKHERQLHRMLTFCARKCILLNWISDKAPSKSQWHRMVLDHISLDYLTNKLHGRDDIFHKTWDPFMSYIGLDISCIFHRGVM